ncbi:nitrate ABC transporter ATP-binding protein [Clostridium sp. UBA4395]|uniref:nitrate ABC transporter ATP-binding protein n=1 Tax=Clostridium sp. UBA4395 TaxID=1946360 RepID=UPI00321657D5
MKDIKLFERWLKKSLNEKVYLQALKDEVIVTDGFVVFKIKRTNKQYIEVIKEQTFQELNENFKINYRKITKMEEVKFNELFDKTNMEKIKDTNLVYRTSDTMSLKVLSYSKGYIFVDANNIKVNNINDYEIYGEDPVKPILLTSKEIEILVLPVRLCMFPYEIKAI